MFYLNTIEQLFLLVEQLDQLEVCLPYSRLLAGIPILSVFQNLRWNSNKTSLIMKQESGGQPKFLFCSLVNQCEALLFRDKAQLIRAYESQTNETNIFSQLRLLPSDVDRRPFLKCMIGNRSQDIQLSGIKIKTKHF